MKIIIIRHGDPDYVHDSLTPKGWREAELLADRVARMDVTQFYVSPLGRAKDTASVTLKKMNRTAIECEWLREFDAPIHRPDVADQKKNTWDWLPQDWAKEPVFYDYEHWTEHPVMAQDNVKAQYDWVIRNFDALIASYGYVRQDHVYRVERANRDTIVLFCHFGVECVLLSHILKISPVVLWHNFVALPTSVTTLITEEREQGKAVFRCNAFGDISHL